MDASALGAGACGVEVERVEGAVGFYLSAVAGSLLDACARVVALHGWWGAKKGGIRGFVGFARGGEGCAGNGHVLDGILTVGGRKSEGSSISGSESETSSMRAWDITGVDGREAKGDNDKAKNDHVQRTPLRPTHTTRAQLRDVKY